jgi:integrase
VIKSITYRKSNNPSIPSPKQQQEFGETPCFGEVLDGWLMAVRPRLKQTTYSTYSAVISSHIRPYFGKLPLNQVTSELVGIFFSSYAKTECKLSASSIHLLASVLRMVLEYAERYGGCPANSADASYRLRSDKEEVGIMTENEQFLLEQYLNNNLNEKNLGILLCLYTGMRLGEICALRWGDINWSLGALYVRHTVQRIKNPDAENPHKTIVVFESPKSKSSRRCIPLPGFLLELLRKWKKSEDSFILTGSPKYFVEPRSYQNYFKKVLKKAGVQDTNFHTLRHTFATKCVSLGFDAKTLSEILGHSDVSITFNTYVHPSFSAMKSYMGRLQKGV